MVLIMRKYQRKAKQTLCKTNKQNKTWPVLFKKYQGQETQRKAEKLFQDKEQREMTTKGNAYCGLEMKNTIKDIIGTIDKI